jgi:hypothetical protein
VRARVRAPDDRGMNTDTSYLTTYRCIRLGCRMTMRLFNPIERCPRCRAVVETIEQPRRDPEELVAAALADVLAGFETLLACS